MIEVIIPFVTNLIASIGYLGLALLMLLESTAIPLPSELIMPFAGFLIAQAKMSFVFVVIASTLGSLAGSLISYYIGYKGGKHFVKKLGKYFFIEIEHLNKAEKWFEKNGGKTIFFARFMPGIRHVISIPAGAGKMNLLKFSCFTILGAGIWNSFLAYIGFVLEKNWQIVYKYTSIIDMLLLFIVVLLVIYWLVILLNRKK